MKVIVLGCGPAGLMATHAFAIAGHDVLVFSRKRKSEMYGAQYLHAPIPGMTEKAPIKVRYTLTGTVAQYRAKVYGSDSRVEVSPESLVGNHDGWDIRDTYANLWATYGRFVQDVDLDPQALKEIQKAYMPDLIVNTVPRPLLCSDDEHSFISQAAWAIGDAPERGVFCPVVSPPNTVRCNGEDVPGWYRSATVFGYSTAEWPFPQKPPYSGVSEFIKPLRHNCTCHGDDVVHMGRFGKWSKGALSHEAFFESQKIAYGAGVQGTLL